MPKYFIYKNSFSEIIDSQRIDFFKSLGMKDKNGVFSLHFEDKNYNCMPYLESVLDSKIQGLSFFSGGGGLDIGAQMAGIKVLQVWISRSMPYKL